MLPKAKPIASKPRRRYVSEKIQKQLKQCYRKIKRTEERPLQTFTLFPKLPPELRLQIWKGILPGPRLVEIHLRYKYIRGQAIFGWFSPTPPPITLWICRESRRQALRLYCLRFATFPSKESYVYFNFELDTLFFSQLTTKNMLAMFVESQKRLTYGAGRYHCSKLWTFTSDLVGIKRLAVDAVTFCAWDGDLRVAKSMRGLKDVRLVIERTQPENRVSRGAALIGRLYNIDVYEIAVDGLLEHLEYAINERVKVRKNLPLGLTFRDVNKQYLRRRWKTFMHSCWPATVSPQWDLTEIPEYMYFLGIISFRSLVHLRFFARS